MNKPQVNHHQLTNVAIVKLRRCGKKFEIACYKNKVVNWRNGVETDIDEVLQIDSVFSSVSKGKLAKEADLVHAFETTDKEKICRFILAKGKLQVAAKERQVQLESAYRDIAAIVSEKCINPDTQLPYTVSMIERAMKETLHYAVKPRKSPKQQALEIIKMLSQHMPIARARMRVKFTVPSKSKEFVVREIGAIGCELKSVEEGIIGSSTLTTFVCLIDPGIFRAVDEITRKSTNGHSSLEVVETIAAQDAVLTPSDIASSLITATSSLEIAGVETTGAVAKSREESTQQVETETGVDADVNFGTGKSKRSKKKRRKKRREMRKKQGIDSAYAEGGNTACEESDAPVEDLCGYTFSQYKAYWVLKEPQEGSEARDGSLKNVWHLFGKSEKPALWNQKMQGWLVPKKYEEALDTLGAIRY